jgi:3-deoxy-D-manno-octulosonic-acid transferase
MGLYLRLTELAFVGRSLTAEGGQNPMEPAMLGCAVLSGPNVSNFRFEAQQGQVAADCVVIPACAFANFWIAQYGAYFSQHGFGKYQRKLPGSP